MERFDDYLQRLASESPAPGGGSAAMLVAAAGAALDAMVARITLRNPKFSAHRDALEGLIERANGLRAELLARSARDESAFERVVNAQKLPQRDDSEKNARRAALEDALRDAAQAPLEGAASAVRLLHATSDLLDIPNPHLASDAGCAGEFARAALAACAYNVRINHRYMHDASTVAAQSQVLARYEGEGRALIGRIRRAVAAALV